MFGLSGEIFWATIAYIYPIAHPIMIHGKNIPHGTAVPDVIIVNMYQIKKK